MVPLARAFDRIFSSAAVFLSISAHCARGIAQFPTYEYIGGFSFISDVCASAGAAQVVATAIAHSPARTRPNFVFMTFSFAKVQDFDFAILGHASVNPPSRSYSRAEITGCMGV